MVGTPAYSATVQIVQIHRKAYGAAGALPVHALVGLKALILDGNDGIDGVFSIYEILPQILQLWIEGLETTSTPAKK